MSLSATILVAEDEESDAHLLRLAFERTHLPIKLIIVRDGREVLDYLKGLEDPKTEPVRVKPNLLILDLKMPRMTGFEVLTWLKAHPEFKDITVVVFSSSNNKGDIRKAKDLGARDYFVKPPAFGELVKIIQDIHTRYLPSHIVLA